MLIYIFAALIGYLLGSINPAFILGKILKGIDIRKHGTKNAGAMNAFKVLGKKAGIITLIYDFGKGVLAMFLAYWLIFGTYNLLTNIIFFIPSYVAGIFAIIGHNWPFYLRFKGGKGAATTSGLILFLMMLLAIKSPSNIWAVFIIFCILELLILIYFKDLTILGLSASPLLLILAVKYSPFAILRNFLIFFILIILIKALLGIRLLKFNKIKTKFWRKILRLAAVIFPILYLFISKAQVLWFTGIVLCIILIPEIIRHVMLQSVFSKFWQRLLFKEKEEKMKISAITLFLISTFLIILIFEKNIAIAAILIMLFGDMMAGIIGKAFGKHIVVKENGKTFEGFLAFFWTGFFLSLVLTYFINLNIYLLLIGTFFAAIAELYLYKVDDNLTIGIISALAMTAFKMFI